MKKLLLLLLLTVSVSGIRAQSLAWTSWQDFDTSNAPVYFWHFTADSVRVSFDNVNWNTLGGYTYAANVFTIVDDPAQGCVNITDTGRYVPVFSGDTMWLIITSDPCTERADYLPWHYFVRLNTGINEETTENHFSVYPNPGTGIFTIDATANASEVIVTDVTGRVVAQQPFPQSKTLDLTGNQAGVYFITMVFENGSVTSRIVLQ